MRDRQEQLDFILDHYQNPRNHGEMPDAHVHVEGGLPGCGDLITVYLKFDGQQISAVSFTGEGCTISQASASALYERVKGLTVAEVEKLDHQAMIDLLGDELVKSRPRCATLSLDTLRAAVQQRPR
jgi:nitrogen fixation protein NifU and related proteins